MVGNVPKVSADDCETRRCGESNGGYGNVAVSKLASLYADYLLHIIQKDVQAYRALIICCTTLDEQLTYYSATEEKC